VENIRELQFGPYPRTQEVLHGDPDEARSVRRPAR
jgi:hypothetical protein